MECPNCRSTDNQVIDSRLTKDENSVRRRRECLDCAHRFTTYEATEEHLLPLLIRKNTGHGATISSLNTMLSFMTMTLDALSKETEKLVVKVNKLEKSQGEKKVKEKSAARKGRPAKKSLMKKASGRKIATDLTATDTVIKIIKQHKKGIDVSRLKIKTGFDDKKIRNIVHRASKQGKIKRTGRGIYVIA